MRRKRGKGGDAGENFPASEELQRVERLWTVDELADHWQLSTRTIRRMIAHKRLRVLRFGRAVRIHPRVVAELDSQR